MVVRLIRVLKKNPAMQYIISRYIVFAIQFVNSIFIAVLLGPIYLGIWGFVNLVTQYFAQVNFGISHSSNVIVAINKDNTKYSSQVIGNSLFLVFFLCVFVSLLFAVNSYFELGIGEKYDFSKYSVFVMLIACFGYISSLLGNIYRIYGKYYELIFSQSILPFLILITLFFYKEEALLEVLVYCFFVSALLSLLVFLIRMPIKINYDISSSVLKGLVTKGIFLFIYNSSFYLIVISTRFFVSNYYTPKEFGYFTFSFSMATVLLFVLEAFAFLIWPKLINRLSKLPNEEAAQLLNKIRIIYVLSSNLLVYIGIALMPVFLHFLPQYNNTYYTFAAIAITLVLYTYSFGYQGLIIAKGKEKKLAFLSFSALLLNLVFCFVGIKFLKLPYELVIFSTLATYFLYVFAISYMGKAILGDSSNFVTVIQQSFPIRIIFPIFVTVVLIINKNNYFLFLAPLFLYLLLNIKEIKSVVQTLILIIKNPKIFNL